MELCSEKSTDGEKCEICEAEIHTKKDRLYKCTDEKCKRCICQKCYDKEIRPFIVFDDSDELDTTMYFNDRNLRKQKFIRLDMEKVRTFMKNDKPITLHTVIQYLVSGE